MRYFRWINLHFTVQEVQRALKKSIFNVSVWIYITVHTTWLTDLGQHGNLKSDIFQTTRSNVVSLFIINLPLSSKHSAHLICSKISLNSLPDLILTVNQTLSLLESEMHHLPTGTYSSFHYLNFSKVDLLLCLNLCVDGGKKQTHAGSSWSGIDVTG